MVGDIKLHFEDLACPLVSAMVADLASLQLLQLVSWPTHKCGHELHPIFYNLGDLVVEPPLSLIWFDRSAIPFWFSLHNTSSTATSEEKVKTWRWAKANSSSFTFVLTANRPILDSCPTIANTQVCDWILGALDSIAPVVKRIVCRT